MASPRSTCTFTTAVTSQSLDDSSKAVTVVEESSKPDTVITEVQSIDDEESISQPIDITELRAAIASMHATEKRASLPGITTIQKEMSWGGPTESDIPKTYEQLRESQAKVQHFDRAFATREAPDPTKARLIKTSVISAEIKTNVIIRDEYTFLTTLSSFLAARYNRPESSVMLTVCHSQCMLFGGSFEPAYILSIAAVADQVKPTMNRRNAALIQRHLVEELMVPMDRGIIKFEAVPQENLANNGLTLAAEIEQDSKSASEATGFSLSRKLNAAAASSNSNSKKRASMRPSTKPTMQTPPASPPASSPAAAPPPPPLGFEFGFHQGQGHNRNTSDATTSSDPEIDALRGMSQNGGGSGGGGSGGGSSSQTTMKAPAANRKSFFRKLVT